MNHPPGFTHHHLLFLSRVFGGERIGDRWVTKWDFLSRVFGGERDEMSGIVKIHFLSRVFGGERNIKIYRSVK